MKRFATASFATGLVIGSIFFSVIASAWTAPTGTPPTNNASAPVNLGTGAQTKNGSLGVNGLVVFGNTLLGGVAGSNAYLNFGDTSGSGGYGIRDNAGVIETKNSGGSWGTVLTTTTAVTPTSGVFGASATVTLPGTFNTVEVEGTNEAANGNSTNVLTVIFVTIYNVNGTWNYTSLRGGAGTGSITSSGTLTAGVQACPVPATTTYDMKFCLTRTVGGTLQLTSGAATGQGGAFKYTAQ